MGKKGFWSSLFDLSFKSFITPRIVKLLFILAIIGSAVFALIVFASGISMMNYSGGGLLLVLLSPVVFVAGVVYSRVFLELTIVLFRMEEYLSEIASKKSE